MAPAKIVYADSDRRRSSTLIEVLTGAGYAVLPCSGETPATSPASFGTPDLVLLCPVMDAALHALVATLWPKIPTLVLNDPGDYRKLLLQIESTMHKPDAE